MRNLIWMMPLALTACPTGTPAGADGIVSVGSFAGECEGACLATVTFEDGVLLTYEGWQGEVFAEQPGTLTEDGVAELERLGDDLVAERLDETYGCPDCDDGGGMELVLDTDGVVSTHQWPSGEPPPPLKGIDTLFHDVVDALMGCEGTAWVAADPSCVPFERE